MLKTKNIARKQKIHKSSGKNAFLHSILKMKNLNVDDSLVFIPASIEDYYKLEEVKADYYKGNIVMNSPASYQHETYFMKISNAIYNYLNQKETGEVLGSRFTIVFGKNRFEPDIFVVLTKNNGIFKEHEFIGTPDLVIEILSKSTKQYDLINKRQVYMEFKVPEIWFVDYLENKIIIDYFTENEYITKEFDLNEKIESKVLEGIELK